MAIFGQVVIGPPGSGKSTYCAGIYQFLTEAQRPVAMINLDPANEHLPYPADIDIMKLVDATNVADEFGLGPNGALVYCMNYIEANVDWVVDQIKECKSKKNVMYFVLDLPGQVELYTHHPAVRNILEALKTALRFQFCVVNLVDSMYCMDPTKYIAVLLASLSTMVHIELPHINVLSKMDLLDSYGELPLDIDSYLSASNLYSLLVYHEDDDADYDGNAKEKEKGKEDGEPRPGRHVFQSRAFEKLNEAMIEFIEDYAMVDFLPLNITDKYSLLDIIKKVDEVNGYSYVDNRLAMQVELEMGFSIAKTNEKS